MGPGMVGQALEALQNGCVPSRQVALGDSGCEHVFKVIYYLPMPLRATLPNAAVKCRLRQELLPFKGGALLPHQSYRNALNSS
jgi:hypothetical protein